MVMWNAFRLHQEGHVVCLTFRRRNRPVRETLCITCMAWWASVSNAEVDGVAIRKERVTSRVAFRGGFDVVDDGVCLVLCVLRCS